MRIILTISLLSVVFTLSAQKLVKDEVDEFTGNKVRKTSYEKLVYPSKQMYVHMLFVDGQYVLGMKSMLGGVYSIGSDDLLYLKLGNNEVVKLTPMESTVACKGCGSPSAISAANVYGTFVQYKLSDEDVKLLESSPIVKVRCTYSKGMAEAEVKGKRQTVVQDLIKLIKS